MSKPPIEDIYELSPLQAGMLFHCLYAPEAALYFEQVALTFEARLDRPAFDRAWREVIARNPILRTSFHWEDIEKPLQVVHPDVTVEIEHLDFGNAGSSGRAAAVDAWLREDRRRGFDLRRAPLFRVAAIRLGPASWHLVLSFHHILLDGWSLPLLFQEFSTLYEAFVQGREPRLDERRPYGDYIGWLQQQDLADAERFWRGALHDYAGPFRLPEDRRETAPDSPERFSDEFLALPPETTASLQAFCRREQITLNTLVQAAWALVLARYGQVHDVMFGAIVSGRPPQLAGVESMIGMFINTIPVRIRVPSGETVGAWLRRIQADQFEARRYEYSPLIQVQGWSGIARGTPLFETILVFENYPRVPQGSRPGQKSANARAFERTNYPLCLVAGLAPELQFRLLYDERRFSRGAIARLLTHVAAALEALAASAMTPPRRVSFLTSAERETVLAWSRGPVHARQERCIHEVFAAQAARTPRAMAITAPGSALTFGELHERARALALELRAAGVGPEVPVGIAIERSPDQIVALLAVLDAGGAFVPLDVDHPRERLDYIVGHSNVRLVLTSDRPIDFPSRVTTIDVRAIGSRSAARANGPPVRPANLAYVIYTSGSTGRPKGVMAEHRGALNRFEWMWRARPFQPGELCAVKTPLGFVDSIWEIFGPLLAGVGLALIPDAESREPDRLIAALSRTGATRVVVVPAMLRALLDCEADLSKRLPRLRHWTVSGEPLPADLARRFRHQCPGGILWNLYGASEVAGDATGFEYPGRDEGLSVPIGRPVDNTGTYVLDADWRPAPVGVPGELFVDGRNLARGYLSAPDATAGRFLPNPFSSDAGGRLYRTGDIVRWREGGELEYLGRADTQVKLRGVRIEPAEIESVAREHPQVRDAVVVLRDLPSGPALTMYFVPRQWPAPEAAELRMALARKLPDVMIPVAYVALPEFPLTESGKVRRQALPDPEEASSAGGERRREPPHSRMEERVAAIWSAVLNRPSPGRHDGFFESGGHSLLATQLVSRLREEFAVDLPLRTLFEAQTIAGIAEAIAHAAGGQPSKTAMPAIVPVARGGGRRAAGAAT